MAVEALWTKRWWRPTWPATLVLIVVLASVVPLGANRDWAWATIVALLGLLCVIRSLVAQDAAPLPRSILIACLAAGTGYAMTLAVAGYQIFAHGGNERTAALFQLAADALSVPVRSRATLDVYEGRHTIIRLLTYGGVFVLAASVFRNRDLAYAFLAWLIIVCAGVTTYGLLVHAQVGSCVVFEYVKVPGGIVRDEVCPFSGTFVSKNSYATFVGMGLLAVACLTARVCRFSSSSGSTSLGELLRTSSGRLMALLVGAVYLGGGMLLSSSRAGILALVIASTVFWAAVAGRAGRGSGALLKVIAPIFLVLIIVVFILSGATLATSVSTLEHQDNAARLRIWTITLRAIEGAPWLGWGLGSYPSVFSLFQTADFLDPNDKAHSLPLELIAEVGIVGASGIAFAVLVLLYTCLRGALTRHRDFELPALALAIGVLTIGHSLVDFSLQMPAIALIFSAVLGLGVGQSASSRTGA